MNINLILPEIEQGYYEKRISDKRLQKLREAKAICPIWFLMQHVWKISGLRVNAVLVTEITPVKDGLTRVSFEGITAKAFTVFNSKSKELNRITCVFPSHQHTFDKDGNRETSFTLEGAGVDPDLVEDAWERLKSLHAEQPSNPLIRGVMQHIKEKFTPVAV